MKRIAIFASGTGTNAAKIIARFTNHPNIEVGLVVCNKSTAGVLAIAAANHIPSIVIDRDSFMDPLGCLAVLQEKKIDWVVLAGFLWKIPADFVTVYPSRIINIHPALLPKYGGKGMYGMKVHEAVIAAGEKETGITIHYVNEHYDEGTIIFQARCSVLPTDTAEDVAEKVHRLEHEHFPQIIEQLITV